jgi:hypothetical protein
LLQGYIELSDIKWNAAAKNLSGKAQLVEDEQMTITIACNGLKCSGITAVSAESFSKQNGDLLELSLKRKEGGETAWTVDFK